MESQQNANTVYVSSSDKGLGSRQEKKKIIALAVTIAVLVIAILVYFLVNRADGVDASKPVHTVTIGESGFTPSTIKIKKGEELAWSNKDNDAHEITADQQAAPGLDSTSPLAEGDTYIFEFEETGTINYYDPLNPTAYKGTVIVE